MKKLIVILFFALSFITIASAIEFEARTGVANQLYTYQFNFTTNADCSGVLLSYTDDILTDSNGNYFFSIPTNSLTSIPYYLCEYKDSTLRKTHNFSDIIFRSIRVQNITTEKIFSYDWTNVTITESQISDLDHFDTTDETDPEAYNGTLAYNSSLADFWRHDGTSTSTGNWDISPYNFSANGLNISSNSYFNGSLMPSISLMFDIGSGAYRWRNIYGTNLSIDDIEVARDIIALGDITADNFHGSGANLTDLNVTGVMNVTGDFTGYEINISYLSGHGGIGRMDLRGDPWYLAGTDLEIDSDLKVNNTIIENDLTVEGNTTMFNLNVTGVINAGDLVWNGDLIGGGNNQTGWDWIIANNFNGNLIGTWNDNAWSDTRWRLWDNHTFNGNVSAKYFKTENIIINSNKISTLNSDDLYLTGGDNVHVTSADTIYIKPSGDITNYFKFDTLFGNMIMYGVGGNLSIHTAGKEISFWDNNVVTTGNISADTYFGDGSQLTGISGGNESFNQTLTDSLYRNLTNKIFYNGITTNGSNLFYDPTNTNRLTFYCTTTQCFQYGYSTTYTDVHIGKNLANQGLHYDASLGRVGINDDTPTYTLDVAGDIHSTARVKGEDLDANDDIFVNDMIVMDEDGAVLTNDEADLQLDADDDVIVCDDTSDCGEVDFEVQDGHICADDENEGNCGSTDGYMYADDYIEYTSFYDVNVFGSALDEIKKHIGSYNYLTDKSTIDYSTYNDFVKHTDYKFPKDLLVTGNYQREDHDGIKTKSLYEEFDDITPKEFYNNLPQKDKDRVTILEGVSVGSRASQNEQAILELLERIEFLEKNCVMSEDISNE